MTKWLSATAVAALPAAPPPSNPTDDGSLNVVPPNSPYGKSCVSSCGGSSPDGSCWCDNSCAEYGDCCTDKATAYP